MRELSISADRARARSWRRDLLVALALGAFLSIAWTVGGWADLSRLILPDTDDMMRLAQVRDWLAGQAMNDWMQYRVAPPHGSPMHWSRINDLGLAAVILAATPALGRHCAELAAVLLYPAALFTVAIWLSARIARRLWSADAALPAAVIAALAYPGTTVFAPGRIDHHALQTVLILLATLAIARAPSLAGGAAMGVVVAFSLMVGLETAPQLAALILLLFALWTRRGEKERARLGGFAAALAATTTLFLLLMRPTYWSAAYCDAFTPASATGILLGGGVLGLLAALTRHLAQARTRLVAGGLAGGAALATTVLLYPTCVLGPYGLVDPILRVEFLAHIDEANGLFEQPTLARVIKLGGLVAMGCAAAVWMIARRPRRWPTTLPAAAVVLMSGLVMLAQVRGAYIGAPAAAPVLAGLVITARRRTTWRASALAGAWLLSTGVSYAAIPQRLGALFGPAGPPARTPHMVCNGGDAWAQVDRLPRGVVMSPTNMAAYIVGATDMATVGAGYHRVNEANVALYRYFLGPPDAARAAERRWGVDYVAFCPGDFDEIRIRQRFPDSLGAMLAIGRAPAHFRPVPLHGTRLRLYRVPR